MKKCAISEEAEAINDYHSGSGECDEFWKKIFYEIINQLKAISKNLEKINMGKTTDKPETNFGQRAYSDLASPAIELTEMRNGKRLIRYFVSYSHKDRKLKDELLNRLKDRLNIAREYYFEPWDDEEILPGERWHEQIQEAVGRCHFGLLLVSTAFLGSGYIKDNELPAFVATNLAIPEPDKRVIPVALKRILFNNTIDLKGLEHLQIFHDSAGKTFQERSGDRTRDDFATELFEQILKFVSNSRSLDYG